MGLLLCSALLFGLPAAAATGYYALDNAAIPLKQSSAASLVSIVRAGKRLCAVGTHGVIIYSDDNGASWKQASTPVDLTLTALYFESPQKGWAVGHYGVVLGTDDGGRSWTNVLNGLDIIRSLGVSSELAQQSEPSTPDAALQLHVATAFKKDGPNKVLLAIGKCGGGILAAGQQDLSVFSNDDGKNWNEWTSRIPNPNFNNIYQVLDEGDATYLVGEQGMVLKSASGCGNFQPVSAPATATLFGALLLGPGNVLVYGLDGTINTTADDGKTWKVAKVPPDAVIDSGIVLANGDVLLAALGGAFFLSKDKGLTFKVYPYMVSFQIAGIAQAPDGDIVVAGDGGVAVVPLNSLQ